MRQRLSTILLVLILLLGLGILLYPTVSDYWNTVHQWRAIAKYTEKVALIQPEDYTEQWEEAVAYNSELTALPNRWLLDEEQAKRYNGLLNFDGSGVMGYIEIPKIGVSLPLYHGTDEAVLQTAIGHVEGSSLPTGGLGTHAVFSGHRGLPSAKLFSNLDQLEPQDIFIIRVMDEIMTYEVDQVLIVLRYEMDALAIDPDQDYCTLVTCTPYGINTHRLLVRGHRVANPQGDAKVVPDAMQIDTIYVIPFVGVPILLLLLIMTLLTTGRHARRRDTYVEVSEWERELEQDAAREREAAKRKSKKASDNKPPEAEETEPKNGDEPDKQ